MPKTGRPISDEERRERDIWHLFQYGLKMTVRRDIGGTDSIANHSKKIAEVLRGRTADEAGECMAESFAGWTPRT